MVSAASRYAFDEGVSELWTQQYQIKVTETAVK